MKFRIVTIYCVLMLALLVPVHYFVAPAVWWYPAAIAVMWLTTVFLGCIILSMNFFIPVLCKANTTEKVVALTFDDGPNIYTPQILDTLKANHTPSAFFCIGKHIAGNEAVLMRMNDEGHIIGNHSYTHDFWFDMLGWHKMLAELQQMSIATEHAIGRHPLLFRPPYGVMNPNLAKAIKEGGYTPIGWTIRSFDTKAKDKEKLLSRITGQLKPGAIILLHDSMPITAEILPELIKRIHDKGYKIVRADKMLNIQAYA